MFVQQRRSEARPRDLIDEGANDVFGDLCDGLVVVVVDFADAVSLSQFHIVDELYQEVDVVVQQLLVDLVIVDAEVSQELEALAHDLDDLVVFAHVLHVLHQVLRFLQQADYRKVHVQVFHHKLPVHLYFARLVVVVAPVTVQAHAATRNSVVAHYRSRAPAAQSVVPYHLRVDAHVRRLEVDVVQSPDYVQGLVHHFLLLQCL